MIRFDENRLQSKDLLATAFRNKKKLIAYNLLMLMLVVSIVLFFPRRYRSEAKVWLKIGRENTRLDPTLTTGERIMVQETDREDEIKSVIDIVGSRQVAAAVVDTLGPDVVIGNAPLHPGGEEKPPGLFSRTIGPAIGGVAETVFDVLKSIDPVGDRERAVIEIVENLGIDAERKSNVVSLSFDTKSPELAQAIVQAVITSYQAEHTRIHTTVGSQDFFAAQSLELQQRVSEAAEALRQAKQRIGLASVQGQRESLENQMLRVQNAKLETNQNYSEATARAKSVQSQIISEPKTIQSEQRSVPNTGRDGLQSQLYSLQVLRMELEAKLSPENPRLQAILKQEADALRELTDASTAERAETTESINSIHQSLAMELVQAESRLAGLAAMRETLDTQEQDLLIKVDELNEAEIEIRQFERDLLLAETNYMEYSRDVENARIDEALTLNAFSNISIAQFPTLQEKPVSPSKLMAVLLGGAAMFFGSTAIVAGMHLLQPGPTNATAATGTTGEPLPSDRGATMPRVVTVPHQRRHRQLNS